MFSWFLTHEADTFWNWWGIILGIVVAVTVLGESVDYIPPRWRPVRLRSEEAARRFSIWCWAILVLALVLEVGVALAKNQIETALYNELESRIAHATRLDRLFTNDSEMQRLADMLRKFAGTTYSVTVDSADYNVNSEQEKFSVQLKNILQAAGWKLSIGRSWAPTPNRGILIGYRSDSAYSKAVVSDLVTIFAQFDIQSAGDPFSDLDEHTITFEIGMR